MKKRYKRDELINAYARHLFDGFGVDCGLYHDASDMDLNFEDFDECVRNTPKNQLNSEYFKNTIEDFVEEYPLEEFEVTLTNSQCIFDDGTFYDFESAIEFCKGRGGTYNVQIAGPRNDLALSCDGNTFSEYDGCEWIDISENEIKKVLCL